MSMKTIEIENGQSQSELVKEMQLLKIQVEQLKKEKAENEQTIAQLRKDCVYFEKAILALSRSRITADQLVQWLNEEPEEGFTFEEIMAELQGSNTKDS